MLSVCDDLSDDQGKQSTFTLHAADPSIMGLDQARSGIHVATHKHSSRHKDLAGKPF
jgi:hypothetical protein